MALRIYASYPFSRPVGLTDTYSGNGTQTLFDLINNTSDTLAGVIQFDLTNFIRLIGGYTTPTSSEFVTATAPPLNSQGITPALSSLPFPVFDVTSIPGNTSANIRDVPFYLADPGDGITTNSYNEYPGNPGIAILFQNLVTAAGAQTTWTQLACANADGSLGTYQATGTTLYTAPYYALSTLTASAAAGATTLQVASASGFYAGDFIILNPGGGTVENPQITNINYSTNTLTITGTNYNHFIGESALMNARKFYARVTMPVGALDGIATTFYNLALQSIGTTRARF